MPKIKVNDIAMYYETHGEGEPIIFIGGFSVDHLTWHQVVAKFADQYQVILFDNRGAGQSDVSQGPYTIEQMAKDIVDLCAALNIQQAHFIGNSMGGYLVQTLAYRYPMLVKSAVISNSTMVAHTCFHFYLAAQLALLKTQASLEAIIKASCSWVFSFQFLSQPNKLAEIIQLSLMNPHPFTITAYEGQYAALNAFDSRSWAKEIKAPTLIISGEQDLVFDPSNSEALANQIEGAQYYCFKECGHLPHIEYPDLYATVIKNFLAQHRLGSS